MDLESRQEKDAMTVEIMFALMTGVALGAVVFGVLSVPALIVGVSESTEKDLLQTGVVLAVLAAVWRVTRVLRRFGAGRRRRDRVVGVRGGERVG